MKAGGACGVKRPILHTGGKADWHSHYGLAHPKYWIGKKKKKIIQDCHEMLRENLSELFGQPNSMAIPQKTKNRVAM